MTEVMMFYKKLIGTKEENLKHVDIEAMRCGKQVNPEEREYLIKLVTKDEIWNALKGIGDHKAPGIDAYGAKIFKTNWSIVKKDVITAAQNILRKVKFSKLLIELWLH